MVKLIPAFIDDKNIVSDFVYSDLYDNNTYVVSDKDDAVGFINNIPVCASYKKETMTLNFPKMLSAAMKSNLVAAILKRLSGNDKQTEDVYDYNTIYLSECLHNDGEQKISVAMQVFETCVEVAYYWQVEK